MIFESLELVRAELEGYLKARAADSVRVELGSIATSAGTDGDQVLISLVNVEEEAALRNSTPYQRNATGGFNLVNPPVFLNLYLLVAANFRDGTYGTALKRLAWVVQCFQRKNELSATSLRLTLDLYSLSFEKISQIWGTLGGKQIPFVLYKARVVEEQAAGKMGEAAQITSIERRASVLAPPVG